MSKSTISIPQAAFSTVYVDSLESVRYYSGIMQQDPGSGVHLLPLRLKFTYSDNLTL